MSFLFLSRLLKAKGLVEFLDAAAIMKGRNSQAKFLVYGQVEDSSLGVEPLLIQKMHKEGIIYYGGVVHDVRTVIKSTHVLVLPTFYREGLPRCIQEAMAIGRPVITTDFAGCSNILDEKTNGLTVPAKDVTALVSAMEWFCSNEDILPVMAAECRKVAEKYFDCNKSDETLIKLMI